MRARTIAGLTTLSLALIATAAAAEEKAPATPPVTMGETPKPPAGGRVIVLEKVTIPGRVQRPHVTVDVNRLVPRAPLPELRKSLVDHIGNPIEKDPF